MRSWWRGFQGKLSFSWPKKVTQAVINVGDKEYDPLFPYGYGLNYAEPRNVANNLDESTVRLETDALEESWMFVSREMSDYQFKLADDGADPVIVNGNRDVSAADENLLLLSVDKIAQEDARRLAWNGSRPATVSLAAKHPLDMSQYLGQSSALSFSLKVDVAPKGDVSLSMLCGDDCGSLFTFTDLLKKAKLGKYIDYKIGLQCFMENDAQFDAVTDAFVMRSTDRLDVVVADIKIIANVAKDDLYRCD
ncbi:MAG: beta-glucosidase [Arenicella sp.]|jgi:beta-glucosidase